MASWTFFLRTQRHPPVHTGDGGQHLGTRWPYPTEPQLDIGISHGAPTVGPWPYTDFAKAKALFFIREHRVLLHEVKHKAFLRLHPLSAHATGIHTTRHNPSPNIPNPTSKGMQPSGKRNTYPPTHFFFLTITQ